MSNDQALWGAVIAQAISDATCIYMLGVSAKVRPLEADRARRWLTKPNKDFATVCALAGVEPDAVRQLALTEIAAFDARKHAA